MSETIVVPDNNGNNNGWNSPLGLLALGNNGYGGWGGNGFLGGGFGAGILGGVFGGLLTNWIGGNGFGNGGWGGNGAAASLGAQATANNNTDLLMSAITSQGEQSRQAVQTLSTMLGQDFNLVNDAVNGIQTALATVAANQGMNTMQVVNAIQSGNAALASQLCQCCCDMRQAVLEQGYQGQLRTVEQTGTLMNGISGVNQNIDQTRAAQQLSDCQQTYTITDTNNRNTAAIINKLDAMQTQSLQDKLDAARAENTRLSSEISQANQNAYITGMVSQAIAPINAQLSTLNREVDDIKCNMPPTVAVQWPQLTAVNTTPYVNGGFYGNAFGNGFFGNGFNGFGGNIVF